MALEGEKIRIILPVDARFAKTLRLGVSSIATLANFTIEEIEDLKIAVEEAFLMAVEQPEDSRDVEFKFTLYEDRLEMRVGTLPAEWASSDETSEREKTYGLMILRAVVDEARFADADGGTELLMIKRKERGLDLGK